jgi:ribosomal protein S18 acetylase RimI-like enzyme
MKQSKIIFLLVSSYLIIGSESQNIHEKIKLLSECFEDSDYCHTIAYDELSKQIGEIETNNECEIKNFFIDHDFRKKGIGTLLMQNTIQQFRNNNCKDITLKATGRAIGFYEKFGFLCQKARDKDHLSACVYRFDKEKS